MASEIKVDTIVNAGGDNDTGIDLSTNDQILLKVANATKLTMNSTGQTTIVGEGGTTTTNLQQGLAKQWVYFDMASTTAIDSFNNSSLTDNATGKFVANVANDFANTSYAVNYQGNAYAGDTFYANVSCIAKLNYVSGSFATGTYDIISYGGTNLIDGKYNYTVAHGDLA